MPQHHFSLHTVLLRAAAVILTTVLLFSVIPSTSATEVLPLRGRLPSPPPPGTWGIELIPTGEEPPSMTLSEVNAQGALLLEAESGEVIFGQDPNARLPMASTTKIMTALVALESLPPDTEVKITAESVGVEGSSIYLQKGETLSLEQLLYALMLESANDAASAIAIGVAGSVEAFADKMNERARTLGLVNTHFVNPHGLDDPSHYTTAYELAMITREALENPIFRKICATPRHAIPLQGDEGTRVLVNHNRLLSSYPGCIGVKTGYTKRTGRCLVTAAQREGVTLIAVTLNAPDDWRTHKTMLDYGFSLYKRVLLWEEEDFSIPLWLVSGEQEYVMPKCSKPFSATLRRDHGAIRCVVELPPFVYAPVYAGEFVGRLRFVEVRRDGTTRELGSVPLRAAYGVKAVTYPQGLWGMLKALLKKMK